MSDVFKKYPEFITSDPRVKRKSVDAYPVDSDFAEIRHRGFFNSTSCKNKSVLDLGCCVGATGAWVLESGAEFYHGVEIDRELCLRAEENLSKYFDRSKFKIEQVSIEKFLESNTKKFDLTIASGIMYGFFSPVEIIDALISVSDELIIESVHQYHGYYAIPNKILSILEKHTEWQKFVEDHPTLMLVDDQEMMLGVDGKNVCYTALVPSMGFIKNYISDNGYQCNLGPNDILKETLPEVYNFRSRFVLHFKRDNKNLGLTKGFLNSLDNPKIKTWTK